MIVHDIIGFESRSTVTSSNFLGTKTYGTIAVDSEFKSGMEDISSDVAKEFAQPFKKEVSLIHSFIHSFIHSTIHSYMLHSIIHSFIRSFIHSSFLSSFIFSLASPQPYIFKSTIHSYIVLCLFPLYIGVCQVKL